MASNIKGIIVEIGGDTSGLQKALSKVNSVTSSLSKELRGINSLLKLDPQNTELLTQKQKVLNESIENTKNKIQQLQEIQRKAIEKGIDKNKESQENWRNLQREIINTQNKLKNLLLENDSWNISGKNIEEYGKKIQNIGTKIDNLGNKFTTRLTIPIIALGTLGTKSAMEQEAAIQQVEKIYGEAAKSIKDFANTTAISYNMSSKSAYKYAQVFGNLIQSITNDQFQNAQYTQELLKASSVIASATGRTMEDVMDRIRSGLLGNTEAIEDLGVNVNVALLETTDAFKQFAGDKSWNQLEFQTQQQIRLFGILEQTTKKYGNEINENAISKTQKLTSKLENMGSKLSSKLLPIVEKWIDKADKWIDKLEDLDDATLDNIVRIGLFVASIGPALKIISKLTTAIGTGIKSFGLFKQAIAVINTGAKSTNASVNLLASGITKLTSPLSLATLGIGYMVSAYTLATKKAKEQTEQIKELTTSINENIETRRNAVDLAEEQMQTNLSEISNIQKLKNELSKLVDENGKIKDGYKARVDFILNELNKALGTEYSATGDIINSYKEMTSTINELIAKKRAQIVLEADEEKYKTAIKNKTEAYKTYLNIQDQIAAKQEEIANFEKMHKYGMDLADVSNYKELKNQLNELTESLSNSEKEINDYITSISRYEKNSELIIQGGLDNYNKVYSSIVEVQTNTTNIEEQEMTKRIKSLQKNISEVTKLYNLEAEKNKEAKENIYTTNLEESKKNLQLAIDELTKMTTVTDTMSPDIIEAWKNLAQNSREEYNNAISQMPQDMQNKINDITNYIRNDITVKDAAKKLGEDAVSQLQIDSKFEETGKNWIKGISTGINNKLLRQEALSSMYNFGIEGLNAISQKAWDEHSPSKETEKAAINLLKGVTNGVNKEKSNTINNMLKFGQELINKFSGLMSLNFNSLQNIPSLQNSISQTINTQLKPKIFTPTINITTQHLDSAEMNRIIDTINRKLGEIY